MTYQEIADRRKGIHDEIAARGIPEADEEITQMVTALFADCGTLGHIWGMSMHDCAESACVVCGRPKPKESA